MLVDAVLWVGCAERKLREMLLRIGTEGTMYVQTTVNNESPIEEKWETEAKEVHMMRKVTM